MMRWSYFSTIFYNFRPIFAYDFHPMPTSHKKAQGNQDTPPQLHLFPITPLPHSPNTTSRVTLGRM